MTTARALVLLACLTACGPKSPMETGSTGDGPGTSSTGDPATTLTPSPTTTSPTPSPTTTTVDPTTVDPTTVDPTTVDPVTGTGVGTTGDGFILTPDGGGCIAPAGEFDVRCTQCDPWAQNCPADQKCVPARDGDEGPWTDTACVPLDPEAVGPGESCSVEPLHTRLIDTCDLHSICLGLDPDTLAPECVPLCSGSPDAPECPAGSACLIADQGVLIPCLPTCDPVAGTCPVGQICIPDAPPPKNFVCSTVDGPLAQQFEPCDAPDACAAGLVCVDALQAVECDPQQGDFCCIPFCDLDQPTCPGVGQQCQPVFPDQPPPGLAHVGVCALP